MHLGEIISVIALFCGTVMGLGALFSPAWASKVVRLVEDPDPLRPGGYSEFRATYGGVFLFAHLITALLVLYLWDGEHQMTTALVVLPLAAGWIGAAIGRTMSLILDTRKNREPGMIPIWIPTELILGLAIGAPFLQFVLLTH
ncbi:hypothetical protein HY29_06005 [Hyphomonas beringensis]|uniref:DUF4345 domain-containing protein n=1 Tax=Hyphomonas beringensis TaxID=1280946 RepID=A0A062U100_9PROT|nr:hypothetical protein [Hyphomonas beringensis]KCZ51418.1 hypothetical protein HY29_06005 [Hyphomonas beringensis]